MSSTADTLTILTTFGPLLTKVAGASPDGRLAVLKDYDNAEHFRSTTAIVHGLADILAVLEHLASCPRSAIIRGAILPGTDSRRCKRLLRPMREDDGTITPATFQACPRRWLACDFDSVATPMALPGLRWLERPAETAAFLAGRLPAGFRQASCILQATSGAGIKPGIRARAWYWLDRPVSDAEAKRWLGAAPVDLSLFRGVQLHYTAAPVFRGCPDPLPQRLWLVPGEREAVPVPNLPEPPPRLVVPTRAPTPSAGPAYARAALRHECDAVASAATGDRHASLNRAAFSLARFIVSGELAAIEVVSGLLWAARRGGLEDSDGELRRFLRYGLRAGAERAGVG